MKIFYLLLFLLLSLSLHAQEIALTFDDAPTPDGPFYKGTERTDRILAQLKETGVDEVAFFVITNQINEQTRQRLLKYEQAGHRLANHTHAHRWIHQIGTRAYLKDIIIADSVLRQYKSFSPWFRYPFLNEGSPATIRDSIRATLKGLGVTNGYVTIDNYDWYLNGLCRNALRDRKKIDENVLKEIYIDHVWKSIQFYDNVARKTLGRSPKHVLLLHENDLTAKFLKDLIVFIQKNGWKIISPTEAYTDPIANHIPDVLFNNQGRVAAIAREKGTPAPELVQESEDEAYLDALVKAKNVFK
jgi:peptidoglycan-N-acetylglucosamine deacetylase